MEILKGYFSLFASPQMLIMILLLAVFYLKNTREAGLRRIILGDSEDSPLVLTLYQVIYGIGGGLVISLLAGVLNIAFQSYLEVQIIFLLTIFSVTKFSGYVNLGIHVLAVFLLGLLLDREAMPMLDLLNLYLFMGLLYIIHGVMLFLDGHRGFLPVLFSKGKDIRGGFRIQKMYLIPAAVGFYAVSGSILGISVFYLSLFHLFHVQETVMTFSKKQAVQVLSGIKILTGSLMLIGAYITSFFMEWTYLILVLMPLLGYLEKSALKLLETRRAPYYVSEEKNILVLEVREQSPAHKAGLRSGCRVLSLDGKIHPSYKSLMAFMGTLHYDREVHLEVLDEDNLKKRIQFRLEKGTSTGIIIVPPSGALNLAGEEKG